MSDRVTRRTFCAVAACAAMSAACASAERPSALASADGPNAQVASVLAGALGYLVSIQREDGSWRLSDGGSPVGITGYAVLAFLAAGAILGRNDAHRQAVSHALAFLARCCRDDGIIYCDAPGRFPHTLYDHAAATAAMARADCAADDAALRDRVRRAAAFILSTQDAGGGWRYKPVAQDPPDLPVTAAQLWALRAASDAGVGFDLPRAARDRAVAYVRRCHDDATGAFSYTPDAHNPAFSRAAAGVCALLAAGVPQDDSMVKRGFAALGSLSLLRGRREAEQWLTFGRFYGAEAMRLGNVDVASHPWCAAATRDLLGSAKQDGAFTSWSDAHAIPADAVYHTSLNVTALARFAKAVPG